MRRISAQLTPTLLVIAATLVVGCSGGNPVPGWFGSDSKTSNPKGTFFAAVDNLAVRESPRSSSKTVGYLRLHDKVTRSKIENGFALVRSADGSTAGWVVNAKLLWKLPSSPEAAPEAAANPASEPAAKVAPESPAEEAAPESPPAPAPDADTRPARKTQDRSGAAVFDPY